MKKNILIIICSMLVCVQHTFAQQLTLYIIPAPKGIDWSSPHQLLNSYLKNMSGDKGGTLRHAMGHVMVELKDDLNYALIGAAPQGKYSMSNKVIWEGYGFGAFYYGFKGKLEEADVNVPDIQERLKTGQVTYLKIKLSPENFSRLWTYMEEYRQFGYDKVYNGTNRPRHGEGAGCSAFAVSFLEVAGTQFDEIKENWKISVRIPEELVGGPVNDGAYVPIFLLFFANRWADTEKEGYKTAEYYEPTMMYQQITDAFDNSMHYAGGTPEVTGKAKGFVFDLSGMPAPEYPVWLNAPPVPSGTISGTQIKFE